jgi:hypothetical protein
MSIEDAVELESDPIEIDPPTCEQCGCVIEDLEALIYLRAADLVAQWERADPRDAWRLTGDPAPPASVRNSDISANPANAPRPYRTPQATIDAFLYVARNHDVDYVARWLENHPQDVATLTKLWEAKNGLS